LLELVVFEVIDGGLIIHAMPVRPATARQVMGESADG
jgi:hypothetical protein